MRGRQHKFSTPLVFERKQTSGGSRIGVTLDTGNHLALLSESRMSILRQLRAMIAEMRAIPPPKNMEVASVDGASLYGCPLPVGTWRRSSNNNPFNETRTNR